jgi:hypothetical protein
MNYIISIHKDALNHKNKPIPMIMNNLKTLTLMNFLKDLLYIKINLTCLKIISCFILLNIYLTFTLLIPIISFHLNSLIKPNN